MDKLPRSEKPMSVRIPPKLMARLILASKIMGIPKQEVLRQAAEIGLEHLRRIDYDTARAIIDAHEGKEKPAPKGNHHPKAA